MTPADQALHVVVAAGFVVLGAFAAVGLGCAVAVVGAAFPRAADRVDRQARATGAGTPLLVGALSTLGALAVVAGAARLAKPVGGVAAVVLGVPLFVAWVAGLVAVVPLVGERILGATGPSASPIRRAVTGALAFGLAALPAIAVRPLVLVLGLLLVGWPVGVALLAALGRTRRAASGTAGAATPSAP